MTLHPDIQCKTCVGDGRPVQVHARLVRVILIQSRSLFEHLV